MVENTKTVDKAKEKISDLDKLIIQDGYLLSFAGSPYADKALITHTPAIKWSTDQAMALSIELDFCAAPKNTKVSMWDVRERLVIYATPFEGSRLLDDEQIITTLERIDDKGDNVGLLYQRIIKPMILGWKKFCLSYYIEGGK